MKPEQTLQILTNRSGRIVGVLLEPPRDSPVGLRMTPLKGQIKGQSWHEVRVPSDAGPLREGADFRRLAEQFQLPRGRKELVRVAKAAKRKRKRAK
jgi:hypothetical protein